MPVPMMLSSLVPKFLFRATAAAVAAVTGRGRRSSGVGVGGGVTARQEAHDRVPQFAAVDNPTGEAVFDPSPGTTK